jgi:hypothetical protein
MPRQQKRGEIAVRGWVCRAKGNCIENCEATDNTESSFGKRVKTPWRKEFTKQKAEVFP